MSCSANSCNIIEVKGSIYDWRLGGEFPIRTGTRVGEKAECWVSKQGARRTPLFLYFVYTMELPKKYLNTSASGSAARAGRTQSKAQSRSQPLYLVFCPFSCLSHKLQQKIADKPVCEEVETKQHPRIKMQSASRCWSQNLTKTES